MGEKIIVKCRICGKLMSRWSYMAYSGDETCCRECNKEADKNDGAEPRYSKVNS